MRTDTVASNWQECVVLSLHCFTCKIPPPPKINQIFQGREYARVCLMPTD